MNLINSLKLLLLSLVTTVSVQANTIDIYYIGDLNGAIEPCGCSDLGKLGGLQRHAVFFKDIDRSKSLLLANGRVIDAEASSEMIKAEFILTGMIELGYDAIAMQQQDSAFGSEIMLTDKLPWVSSNLKLGDIPASRQMVVNDIPVNIYSLARYDADPSIISMSELKPRAEMPHPSKDGLNILMTSYHKKRLPKDIDLSPYHIIITRNRGEFGDEVQVNGEQIILGPGIQGMFMGHLKGEWKDGKFRMISNQFVRLDESYDQPNKLSEWFKDYEAALKKDYETRAAMRKAIDTQQAEYLGTEACQTCHTSAYQKWATTKHANAFETLIMAEKQFDPSCIKCHVVGFNQTGGYLDEYITPHLQNVGCEACHGPGRKHVQSAGQHPMAKPSSFPEKCLSCHHEGHSPNFEFSQYFPKIAHPKP